MPLICLPARAKNHRHAWLTGAHEIAFMKHCNVLVKAARRDVAEMGVLTEALSKLGQVPGTLRSRVLF
jgi:hypothetical protein